MVSKHDSEKVLSILSDPDIRQLLTAIVQENLSIRSHLDLLQWLQGSVQELLPHDVLIAAWGDFALGLIHFDVISSLPKVRTENLPDKDVSPFLIQLFDRWNRAERRPMQFDIADSLDVSHHLSVELTIPAIEGMQSVLVHGIKDYRGRHDCLFAALRQRPGNDHRACLRFEMLIPYIDTALRQLTLLPRQDVKLVDEAVSEGTADSSARSEEHGLSERELEIMHWVALGKTNAEIGMILNISAFTVKNHLQRIFRKLNVLNRAQAVAMFEPGSRARPN